MRGASESCQIRWYPAAAIALAVSLQCREVIQPVLLVWLDKGDEQEERTVLVMSIYVADGSVGHGIDAIARQAHDIAVPIVHDSVIGL